MFEFIRTHQKLMQFFLLIILAPLFVLGGLNRFGGGDDTTVAKVGNKAISQQELDNALRTQDPRSYNIPGIKQMVLDKLIALQAMNIEVKQNHADPSVSDIQAAVLRAYPELNNPSLSKEDRAKLYNEAAASRGLSVGGLERQIAESLVFERTVGEIQSTAFASKTVAGRIADTLEQEREIQQIVFKTADFVSQVKVTDDMLKAYYNKNLAQFQTPEQAKIEYVVLSADNLLSQMTVTDAEAKAFYDQNHSRYAVDEQRRASHILISVAKGANDTVRAAAKAKAEKLLADVRKNPSDFAKIARENSDDQGTKDRGGDLDFFGKGMMVKPFEDAANKMKVGEISDLVQSDYGYHIIMLTGIKPADVKPFDSVKAEIIAELQKQKATKKVTELRDTFTNTLYEQPDSLKPTADKLAAVNLKIETASGVTRVPDPSLAPTLAYNNPKFLTALFADDSLKNKHNTEVVQVKDGVLIAGRITEYKAAAQKPFEEVQAVVREAVTQAEARDLAQKAADAKLAALKTKDDLTGFGEAQVVSVARTSADKMNPAVVQTILKAYADKLPNFLEVALPGQGFSVVRINKINQPATPDPAHRTAVEQKVSEVLAEQEMQAYLDAIKQKAKVKIVRPDIVNAAPTKDTDN